MEKTQICSKCNKNKVISEFYIYIRKNGCIYTYKTCKECEKNRKKTPEYKKKISESRKNKYKNNKEYRNMMIKKASDYYKENEQKVKNYQTVYHKRNKVVENRHKRRYQRRQTDEEYKIMCNLSSRIQKLLKTYKNMRTNKYIGCTPKFFKQWLEHQFDSNMNWNNYGIYWNIDHVIPCSSFNLKNIDEQLSCFNWTNCRPLCKLKNSSKNNKIIKFQILLQEIRVNYYKKSFCNIS